MFVIAQLYVVTWPLTAHEVSLEVQRLGGRLCEQILDVGDFRDHLPLVGLECRRFEEVRAHAVAQRLRLADVQQRAFGVVELVDAWLIWQSRQLLVERQAGLVEHGA